MLGARRRHRPPRPAGHGGQRRGRRRGRRGGRRRRRPRRLAGARARSGDRSPTTGSTGSPCRGGPSAAAVGLAVLTAVAAAWWPARAAARMPIVAALSGRPPRPQPAHRSAVVGGLVLAGGLVALAFAHQPNPNPPLIIAGTLATTARRAAVRPAGRAGRRRRRRPRPGGGPAGAARPGPLPGPDGRGARRHHPRRGHRRHHRRQRPLRRSRQAAAAGAGNLPANEIVVYLSGDVGAPLAAVPSGQLQALGARVTDIAASLHDHRRRGPRRRGTPAPAPAGEPAAKGKGSGRVAVGGGRRRASGGDRPGDAGARRVQDGQPHPASTSPPRSSWPTTASRPTDVDPTADVLSSEANLAGLQVVSGRANIEHPKIQTVAPPPLHLGPQLADHDPRHRKRSASRCSRPAGSSGRAMP